MTEVPGTEPVRPFTGKEFLESLRGPREVWIYGERVDDLDGWTVPDPITPTDVSLFLGKQRRPQA